MAVYKNDLVDFSGWALEHWLKTYSELLSCYRLESSSAAPDGLRDMMAAIAVLENDSAIATLMSDPKFDTFDESLQFKLVLRAMRQSLSEIFIKLSERGALDRISVLPDGEELPQSAVLQLAKMRASLAAPPQAPTKAKAPVAAEPVPLSDEETCIQDFHHLGSAAFAAKWIRHSGRHAVFQNVSAQGRI